ncbi:hypothetical protein [Clostridium tagluense]|uniref:hypothetical protein n=1 Tax=Clostridium tagluense TaxID=360422 RepID=UPI001CF4E28F|nr:hypothetical protein [Clostridium tagluense]MCB2300114.1 hypothetical protein [Clostridium tagluense]
MTNIIISFCEGHHDIAFLSRVLQINEFKPYKNKIKDFPTPLNTLFQQKLASKNISDSKLGFQTNSIIPAVALYKNNTVALFHNLNGDKREMERKEILDMYQNLIGDSEIDEFTSTPKIQFRFIFFFDADDIGVDLRVIELNSELNLSEKINHNRISKIDDHEWGCYIFHKEEDSGDLEDILLDLMVKDNESIFSNCKDYLQTNELSDNRRRAYICTSEKEDYKSHNNYKNKKSLISVAGQLQFSGSNNSVIISNSDYIKKSDLEVNIHCLNINGLFS